MSSTRKPIDMNAAIEKVNVDNRISLRYYYRIADHLLQEAEIHRQMKNIVDLYVALLKFTSLTSESIPSHRDYNSSNQAEKSYYKKKLVLALNELECLKPEVMKQLDGNGKSQEIQANSPNSKASSSNRLADSGKTVLHQLEINQVNYSGSTFYIYKQDAASPNSSCQAERRNSQDSRYPYALRAATGSIPTRQNVSSHDYMPSAPPIECSSIHDGPFQDNASNSGLAESSSQKNETSPVKMNKEEENATRITSCAVCLDASVEGACVPCGHMAGCMSCLKQVKSKGMGCPVCRAKIEMVLRLYAV